MFLLDVEVQCLFYGSEGCIKGSIVTVFLWPSFLAQRIGYEQNDQELDCNDNVLSVAKWLCFERNAAVTEIGDSNQ
jgi:hypothetical protein